MTHDAARPTRTGRGERSPWTWVPCLLLVLLVAGPSARSAEAERLDYAEIGYVTLDPARLKRPNDERLVLALYDGLTALDARTGDVVPAAAERWEGSPSGREWTFHLRPGSTFSDGKTVRARDFLDAWRRVVDPYEQAPQAALFRPLAGCATILDGDRAMRAYEALLDGIEKEAAAGGGAVSGKVLAGLVEASGVRPFAETLDDASVKRLLRWGDDPFPAAKVTEATAALKAARRAVKRAMNDAFDAFGTTVGARAVDDRTLVVLTEDRCPWLPELVARAAFVPLHPLTLTRGETAFEAAEFLGNGAYTLKGRGPKPRPGLPDPDSVVHIVKSSRYGGPRPGRFEEILCSTDLGAEEDLRRFEVRETEWLAHVPARARERAAKLGSVGARPDGGLLLLRFRVDRPPFDDLETRRAFALALDRAALAGRLWPEAEPALRLLDPKLEGAPSGVPDMAANATAAKAAYEKGGWKGKEFPWVEIQYEEMADQRQEPADVLVKQWETVLKAEVNPESRRPDEMRKIHAAGAYRVSLSIFRPAAADAAAWLLPFRADRPDGGVGWRDESFEARLEAAQDVPAFLEGGDAALARLEADAALRAKVEAARRGGPSAHASLRSALLAAAESRLLEEVVVVPVVRLRTAELRRGVDGVGSDAAWRHPGFVGCLRSAHP